MVGLLVACTGTGSLPVFHWLKKFVRSFVPQKYRTNDFTQICVQNTKYSLNRTNAMRR